MESVRVDPTSVWADENAYNQILRVVYGRKKISSVEVAPIAEPAIKPPEHYVEHPPVIPDHLPSFLYAGQITYLKRDGRFLIVEMASTKPVFDSPKRIDLLIADRFLYEILKEEQIFVLRGSSYQAFHVHEVFSGEDYMTNTKILTIRLDL
jgi:hypothetical protein